MKLQDIMQGQLDSAIAGLLRIRDGVAVAGTAEKFERIGHDLEWVLSHLEDIRHNWYSYGRVHGSPRLTTAPANPVAALLRDKAQLLDRVE